MSSPVEPDVSRLRETAQPPDDANRDGEVALHLSDLELVRLVMQRQPPALERFVNRMQCVPRFVAARNAQMGRPLGNESIEDLVQDVLAVVWRKLPAFQGEAGLETWVYQFCEFELRNAIRRAVPKRARSLEDLEDKDEVGSQEPANSAAGDDLESVYVAMQRLSAAEARIMRLKHFEALTFEAIALRLSMSQSTIKTRYYRALDKLRRHLRLRAEEKA